MKQWRIFRLIYSLALILVLFVAIKSTLATVMWIGFVIFAGIDVILAIEDRRYFDSVMYILAGMCGMLFVWSRLHGR